MVDKLFVHRDATNLTSGICKISRSNRNSTRQLEVHSNIYSCGYRGSIWVSMAPMLIIDWKGFRVMSILHRTYRVTRLRVDDDFVLYELCDLVNECCSKSRMRSQT